MSSMQSAHTHPLRDSALLSAAGLHNSIREAALGSTRELYVALEPAMVARGHLYQAINRREGNQLTLELVEPLAMLFFCCSS